jgi:hypothetical protein
MFEGLIPLLSLVTMLIVLTAALINKERTKDRMRDPNAPISSLAKDGKYGGVGFLLPLDEQVYRTQVLRSAHGRDSLNLGGRDVW